MASIPGTPGNDTLDGGTGNINDTLSGGLGNDLYRYNVGSGNDVIVDTGGVDTLQLGDPNNLNPVWDFSRSGNSLVVDFNGQGRITVTNQFLTPGASIVETLAFADGWGSFSIASGVTGTAGNDLLVGALAAEMINGGAGDDLLFAGAGNDTVLGGDGDDEIYDGLGDDSIVGGAGDEWIEVGGGANAIDGGTGWDNVSYVRATQGVTVNLSGRAQGSLADGHVLKSGGGKDTLAGIEHVDGSAYADVFYGGRTTGEGGYNAGQLSFSGGGGNDTYHVGSGVNGDGAWASVGYGDEQAGVIVNLSNTSVTVNGFVVASKTARDGSGGTDTFVLLGDKLGIDGSDFDDYIRGQSKVNNGWLSGGAGNDTIVGGSSLHDQAGYDSWGDSAVYGAIVNLSASSITVTGVTGDAGSVTVGSNRARDSFGDTDTLKYIESASGSSFNDYIVGSSVGGWFGGQDGNDTLIGGAGEDHIEGGDGNDKLFGGASGDWLFAGAGNDSLDGDTGADTMTGGDGSDTYYVRDTGDVVIETYGAVSFGGTDMVYSYLSAYTLTDSVENGRILATGAASLTGNSLNNVLYAGAGDNTLSGDLGTDTVSYAYGVGTGTTGVAVSLATSLAQATGGSGSDTLIGIENLTGSNYNDKLTGNSSTNRLSGGAGNDSLDGGAGVDVMTGGDGNDTYYVRDTGDSVGETSATGGTDTVHSYLAAYTLGANVENGRIAASGTASLTGNALNNVLYAGAGSNTLDGGAGTDTASYLYAKSAVTVSLATGLATGGSGSDTLTHIERLTGSNYHDTLIGTTSNNILTGGLGLDVLTGNGGNDTFDFNALAEMGTTSTACDVIADFSAGDKIDLSTLDANTTTTVNDAFSYITGSSFSAAGQLKFAGGVLYGNTDSNFSTTEFVIKLTGVAALASSDFVL